MRELRIISKELANERSVWIDRFGESTSPTVILLDGEYYRSRMQAPSILRRETKSGNLSPANYAYVSHVEEVARKGGSTRWVESFCNPAFARFLAETVVPRIQDELSSRSAQTVVVGLSLTGLAAVHAAVMSPSVFTAAVAQSGSFWWNECWLPNRLKSILPTSEVSAPMPIELCCGTDETDAPVDHGYGLVQSKSQWDATHEMIAALRTEGFPVNFHAYEGGHALEPWARHLPEALHRILKSTSGDSMRQPET